jgi:hypothetical protein
MLIEEPTWLDRTSLQNPKLNAVGPAGDQTYSGDDELPQRRTGREPMPQTIADMIASWAPIIVFIGVFIYFTRSNGMRTRGPSGRTMLELYELQLEEMKRNVTALERIAQALERRGS